MKQKIHESVWGEIRAAHASGVGLRELARTMNIPAGTILARSRRESWSRRIEAAKSLARQASPEIAVVDAVALTLQQRGQRHLRRMAGVVEKTLPHIETMEPDGILDRIAQVETFDKLARRTFGLNDGAGQTNVMVSVQMLGMRPEELRVTGNVTETED